MSRLLVGLVLLCSVAVGGISATPDASVAPSAHAVGWETPSPGNGISVSWQTQQKREREPRNVPAMLAGIGLILIAAAILVLIRAWTRGPRRPPPE